MNGEYSCPTSKPQRFLKPLRFGLKPFIVLHSLHQYNITWRWLAALFIIKSHIILFFVQLANFFKPKSIDMICLFGLTWLSSDSYVKTTSKFLNLGIISTCLIFLVRCFGNGAERISRNFATALPSTPSQGFATSERFQHRYTQHIHHCH